jgi:hypothetical protein
MSPPILNLIAAPVLLAKSTARGRRNPRHPRKLCADVEFERDSSICTAKRRVGLDLRHMANQAGGSAGAFPGSLVVP